MTIRTAPAETVMITNNSASQLAIVLALARGGSSPYLVSGPASVPAGGTGVVTVTPKAVPVTSSTVPDAFADTLSITGSGGPINEVHTVALHQTAQGSVLTLSPTALSFTDGQMKTFTVNNDGNLAAPYTLAVGGTNPNSFAVGPTSGNAAGGASVTTSVTYTKPLLSLQPQSASVTLTSSAGLCAPLPAALPLNGQ